MNSPFIEPKDLNPTELLNYAQSLQEIIRRSAKLEDQLTLHLNNMVNLNNGLAAALYALTDSFDANDQAAITLQLQQLSTRRKSYSDVESKVH